MMLVIVYGPVVSYGHIVHLIYISLIFFFFNDTATTEIYTLSLHDALPISRLSRSLGGELAIKGRDFRQWRDRLSSALLQRVQDRKSTRLNSSHANISYAVFCLKKKQKTPSRSLQYQRHG